MCPKMHSRFKKKKGYFGGVRHVKFVKAERCNCKREPTFQWQWGLHRSRSSARKYASFKLSPSGISQCSQAGYPIVSQQYSLSEISSENPVIVQDSSFKTLKRLFVLTYKAPRHLRFLGYSPGTNYSSFCQCQYLDHQPVHPNLHYVSDSIHIHIHFQLPVHLQHSLESI